MQRLEMIRPDDWHLHLRDGEALKAVVGHTARQFARAIVMPNLKPPVTTVALAEAYQQRILAALPADTQFQPLMTLYLTSETTPEEVHRAAQSDAVHAIKLYPAGATTNSEAGVKSLEALAPVLAAMQEVDLPLLIHGESTDPKSDVFDRETLFIENTLGQIVKEFPELRIVFEHITTKKAVDFVLAAPGNVAATITPQHLLLNRNAIFKGGIRPHHYCLPILKREEDRQALVAAATSGNPKFFLGTDSAPHERGTKESPCGCAGIYSAHAAIELYAEAFEDAGAIDKLEGFASLHGPDFYKLPRNTEKVILEKREQTIPASFPFSSGTVVPMRGGETIRWTFARSVAT
ncbi:MAG: dihydroorotase [Polyangiaceae bacterium]|nr:dihydroorotase [Polyangiaceae bacterium]